MVVHLADLMMEATAGECAAVVVATAPGHMVAQLVGPTMEATVGVCAAVDMDLLCPRPHHRLAQLVNGALQQVI